MKDLTNSLWFCFTNTRNLIALERLFTQTLGTDRYFVSIFALICIIRQRFATVAMNPSSRQRWFPRSLNAMSISNLLIRDIVGSVSVPLYVHNTDGIEKSAVLIFTAVLQPHCGY